MGAVASAASSEAQALAAHRAQAGGCGASTAAARRRRRARRSSSATRSGCRSHVVDGLRRAAHRRLDRATPTSSPRPCAPSSEQPSRAACAAPRRAAAAAARFAGGVAHRRAGRLPGGRSSRTAASSTRTWLRASASTTRSSSGARSRCPAWACLDLDAPRVRRSSTRLRRPRGRRDPCGCASPADILSRAMDVSHLIELNDNPAIEPFEPGDTVTRERQGRRGRARAHAGVRGRRHPPQQRRRGRQLHGPPHRARRRRRAHVQHPLAAAREGAGRAPGQGAARAPVLPARPHRQGGPHQGEGADAKSRATARVSSGKAGRLPLFVPERGSASDRQPPDPACRHELLSPKSPSTRRSRTGRRSATACPTASTLRAGHAVYVPFGRLTLQGIVARSPRHAGLLRAREDPPGPVAHRRARRCSTTTRVALAKLDRRLLRRADLRLPSR